MGLIKHQSGGVIPPLVVMALLSGGSLPPAYGDIIDHTRINIDIGFDEAMGWDLRLHDEFTDDVYDPDAVVLYANRSNRKIMPDDPDYAFIGANPGDTIRVLPAVFDPGRLSVGVSTGDIADGIFDSYYEDDPRVQSTGQWIKLTLKGVRGPGEVSVWQNDYYGKPIVWMDTADGIDDSDAVFLPAGGDADFNWAFTAAGTYEIDVQASGYQDGQLITSPIVTYTFGVEAGRP
jgi:surface-anchored protein